MTNLHPFRSTPLAKAAVGWWHPVAATLIGAAIPPLLLLILPHDGGQTFTGPPKNGSAFTAAQHLDRYLDLLRMSFLASWCIVPFAVLTLRVAALRGLAGWANAMLCALALGMPIVYVTVGIGTSGFTYAVPYLIAAIATLGLSVWAAFSGLMALRNRRSTAPSP